MAKEKVKVKEAYDALPPEKQDKVDALLVKLAEPDPAPMTTVDLTTAYDALSAEAQMEISRMVERFSAKAARQAERQAEREARP